MYQILQFENLTIIELYPPFNVELVKSRSVREVNIENKASCEKGQGR